MTHLQAHFAFPCDLSTSKSKNIILYYGRPAAMPAEPAISLSCWSFFAA